MLYCKNCKNKIKKEDKYCEFCGTVFNNETDIIEDYETSKYFKQCVESFEDKNYTKALDCIGNAIKEDENNLLYLFWRAYVLCNKGEYKQANIEFDKLLLKDMNNTAALFWNGYTYSLEKKSKLAGKYFKTILELDSENVLGTLGEGLNLMENGNYDDALKSFNRVLEINNKDIKALTYKTNLLFYLRKYDEALKIINYGLKYYPEEENLILTKLSILGNLEEYQTLLEFIEKILKLPNLSNVVKMTIYYYKGRIALENKEIKEIAKNYLESANYSQNQRDSLYNGLAEIYQNTDNEEFLKVLGEMLKYQENNPYLYLFKGNLDFNQEKYNDAEESYQTALKYDENNIEALKSLYEVKDKLNKKEELESIHKKIIEAEKLQYLNNG